MKQNEIKVGSLIQMNVEDCWVFLYHTPIKNISRFNILVNGSTSRYAYYNNWKQYFENSCIYSSTSNPVVFLGKHVFEKEFDTTLLNADDTFSENKFMYYSILYKEKIWWLPSIKTPKSKGEISYFHITKCKNGRQASQQPSPEQIHTNNYNGSFNFLFKVAKLT